MSALLLSTVSVTAAENRTPTPEEFRELVRKYNESGSVVGVNRPQQVPKAVEQFRRALSLQTKKGASPVELKEAASLYQAALDGGVSLAATNLAILLLDGRGVKKDVRKALSLLNSASEKNDTQADITLARLYLTGNDVKRDENKGEAFLNKAVKSGNQNAVKMLAEYKEWKKKNELSMKQYQDLMKQVQLNQNKPGGTGVIHPMQNTPQLGSTTNSLLFPVIPGYAYFAEKQPVQPNFLTQLPPHPINFNLQSSPAASYQPINIAPQGNTAIPQFKIDAAKAPATGKRATQPAEQKHLEQGENPLGK